MRILKSSSSAKKIITSSRLPIIEHIIISILQYCLFWPFGPSAFVVKEEKTETLAVICCAILFLPREKFKGIYSSATAVVD